MGGTAPSKFLKSPEILKIQSFVFVCVSVCVCVCVSQSICESRK